MEITFELDTSPIGKLGSMPKEAIPKALSYAAQDMTRFLQQNTSNGKPKVQHGLLKAWFISSLTDNEAHIKSPAEYAIYQDQGTSPYIIRPKFSGVVAGGFLHNVGKRALFWEGADHPVTVVHHPGLQGNHFVERSFEQLQPLVPGYFLKALEEVQG